MKKVFLSYEYYKKESFYIPILKDKLESNGVQIFDASSLEEDDDVISALHNSINKCDLLIAFMIGNNLNVIYEVGYAIGKGKKVLIISDDYSEIPFDLKTVPTIILRDYFDTSCDILSFVDMTECKKISENSKLEKALQALIPVDTTVKTNKEIDIEQAVLSLIDAPNSVHKGERWNTAKAFGNLMWEKIFDQIGSEEFENLIFGLLKYKGFNLIKGDKKDIGYDFLMLDYRGFNKTLVEVKKFNTNNKISVGMLQNFLGTLHSYKADYGIFISSSGYTNSAMDFSKNANPKIELWNMESISEIRNHLNSHDRYDDLETIDFIKQRATEDEESSVRRRAVEKLARSWHDDPETLNFIKQRATEDKNSYVRISAVKELARGWHDNPEILNFIKQRATEDKSNHVRSTAVKELARGWHDDPEILNFIKQKANEDKSNHVRDTAVKELK